MKLVIKRIVHLGVNSLPDNPEFYFFPCDMSAYGYIPISEQELTIEVPDDFNPIPLQIKALREEQLRIRTEAAEKVQGVEDRISKLLYIEAPKEVEGHD